jgi:hypothetical protein
MARRRIDARRWSSSTTRLIDVPAPFTAKRGQYLAFIYYYSKIHDIPPAEADFRRFSGSRRPSCIR